MLATDACSDALLRHGLRRGPRQSRQGNPLTVGVGSGGTGWAYSLMRVRIRTGRRHQIRRHMACIGHPVCGDPVYRKLADLPPLAQHHKKSPQAARDRCPPPPHAFCPKASEYSSGALASNEPSHESLQTSSGLALNTRGFASCRVCTSMLPRRLGPEDILERA